MARMSILTALFGRVLNGLVWAVTVPPRGSPPPASAVQTAAILVATL